MGKNERMLLTRLALSFVAYHFSELWVAGIVEPDSFGSAGAEMCPSRQRAK